MGGAPTSVPGQPLAPTKVISHPAVCQAPKKSRGPLSSAYFDPSSSAQGCQSKQLCLCFLLFFSYFTPVEIFVKYLVGIAYLHDLNYNINDCSVPTSKPPTLRPPLPSVYSAKSSDSDSGRLVNQPAWLFLNNRRTDLTHEHRYIFLP